MKSQQEGKVYTTPIAAAPIGFENRIVSRRSLVRLATTLTLGVPFFAFAGGCGSGKGTAPVGGASLLGSGSGSNGGTVSTPFTRTAITGKAELPSGISAAGGRIETLVASSPLQTDGSFQTAIVSGGPQMATLRDSKGNLVLFGFLRDGQTATLTVRTTAEALLYFALGLTTQGPDVQARGLELLKTAPIDAAEAAVRDAITRNGAAWLDANPAALVDVLRTTAKAVGGTSRGRGILVTPTNRLSGITVESDGIGTCKATNYFRRRAYLYSTPISTQADGASATPLPENLTKYEISPLSGVTSLLGTLSDLLAGNTFYTPQSTDVPTPPMPADAAVTKYRLYAVGAGVQVGDLKSFPQTVQAGWREVFFKAVVLDYVVPFFANLVLSLKGEEVEAFLAYNDSAAVLKDLVNALAASSPIFDKALAGNFAEACTDAVQFVWNTDTWKIALLSLLKQFALSRGAVDNGFTEETYRGIGKVLAVPDFAFAAFDTAIQALDLSQSRLGETWDIAVTKPKVTLTPKDTTIAKHGTVTLTAAVVDGDNTSDVLTYHWSVAGGRGHLVDSLNHSGAAFDSSLDVVAYSHDDGFGTDTVTVEVFSGGINNPNRRSLGKNAATITIEDKKPQIVYGRYVTEAFIDHDASGNPVGLVTAYVVTPRVKDAKHYAIRCFGFNDVYYYGTSLSLNWDEPLSLPDKATTHYANAATTSEIWSAIAGVSSNDTGPEVNYLNGRFAGMTVEVTVSF